VCGGGLPAVRAVVEPEPGADAAVHVVSYSLEVLLASGHPRALRATPHCGWPLMPRWLPPPWAGDELKFMMPPIWNRSTACSTHRVTMPMKQPSSSNPLRYDQNAGSLSAQS
jgi:hypothetical protein